LNWKEKAGKKKKNSGWRGRWDAKRNFYQWEGRTKKGKEPPILPRQAGKRKKERWQKKGGRVPLTLLEGEKKGRPLFGRGSNRGGEKKKGGLLLQPLGWGGKRVLCRKKYPGREKRSL